MNLARLALLLLTLAAISGEAATLGLGLKADARDQAHDCPALEPGMEVTEEEPGVLDGVERAGIAFRQSQTARAAWPGRCPERLGLPASGARPCGTRRRHRWVNVDLK